MTAASKVYDGTTGATLTSCTLTGVLGGDVVSCTPARRPSTPRAVGTGKTVTVDGLTLTGAAAGNYALASTTATTTAAITAATVTPTRDGGEQGLRRHDRRDAHELHAERRWSAATW